MNNIALYHLEEHLFTTVGPGFRSAGEVSAFDFLCIVIWKANRAKSKVALKLLSHDQRGRRDLDAITRDLTRALHCAKSPRERLRTLIKDWGFGLPMATAILTVLWPEDFTVYDVRVCDVLRNHHSLQNKTQFDNLWSGYQAFKSDVEAETPGSLSLRDKDRYLWGEVLQDAIERRHQDAFLKRRNSQ